MTNSTTTTTTTVVTAEQIARCSRVIDMETMLPFYMVRSESDDQQEYKVATIWKHQQWFVTCSCPAGLKGINCKHRRWVKAASEEYKKELAAQARRDAEQATRQALYKVLNIEYSDVDTETLKRIARRNANPAPMRQCISGRGFNFFR